MSRVLIFIMLAAMQIGLLMHESPVPREGIHPDVQQYVNEFVKYGKLYQGDDFELEPINIDIGVARDLWDPFLDRGTVGWCKPSLKPLEIMIDEDYWDTSTPLEREQLMFHELGHCILGADHDDSVDENNEPTSLMNSYVVHDKIYSKHREEYIRKLFAR